MVLGLAACAPAPTPPSPPPPVIAGGWQAADPASDAVKDAAAYAVTQLPAGHGALGSVRSAQTQVVAGTNIRMVISLADGTIWEVTVWHRLDGSYALTGTVPKP